MGFIAIQHEQRTVFNEDIERHGRTLVYDGVDSILICNLTDDLIFEGLSPILFKDVLSNDLCSSSFLLTLALWKQFKVIEHFEKLTIDVIYNPQNNFMNVEQFDILDLHFGLV